MKNIYDFDVALYEDEKAKYEKHEAEQRAQHAENVEKVIGKNMFSDVMKARNRFFKGVF